MSSTRRRPPVSNNNSQNNQTPSKASAEKDKNNNNRNNDVSRRNAPANTFAADLVMKNALNQREEHKDEHLSRTVIKNGEPNVQISGNRNRRSSNGSLGCGRDGSSQRHFEFGRQSSGGRPSSGLFEKCPSSAGESCWREATNLKPLELDSLVNEQKKATGHKKRRGPRPNRRRSQSSSKREEQRNDSNTGKQPIL